MSAFKYPIDRRLAALIAHHVFNLQPCDGWREFNFGSAGGPTLMKDGRCPHDNPDSRESGNHCYPRQEINTMGGKIGGPPPYSDNPPKWALWQLIYHINTKWSQDQTQEFYRLLETELGEEATLEKLLRTRVDEFSTIICHCALKVMNVPEES